MASIGGAFHAETRCQRWMDGLSESCMLRPADFSKRDLLCGVLVGAAVAAGIHPALDIAVDATESLFTGYPPDDRRWFPLITKTHARMAILYAGRAREAGGITDAEYIWITQKARMALLNKGSILG